MAHLLAWFFFSAFQADSVVLETSIEASALADLKKLSHKKSEVFQHLESAHEEQRLDDALRLVNELLTEENEEESGLLGIIKARIFYQKQLIKESIEQYRSLLPLFKDQLFYRANLEAILANLYVEQEEYRQSATALKGWIDTYGHQIRKSQLKSYVHNLGLCYLHMEQYDSAKIYLEESLRLRQELKDTASFAIAYMDLANLYYDQYLDDLAIPLFKQGLEFAKIGGELKVLRNAYLNMAVVEENREDFKQALVYRKAYEDIQSKLWNRDKVWELAEQEKQFEVSQKENEIKLLEEREKTQQAALKLRNNQRISLLIVVVLLLIGGTVIARSYRRVRRSNVTIAAQKDELTAMNQTKNRLFSIVAHDLKSPVMSLRTANHALSEAVGQGESKIKAIIRENEQIVGRTFTLLNNLLQWAMDQSNQIIVNPQPALLQLIVAQVVYDYLGPIKEKGIDLQTSIDEEHIVHIDTESMKLVLRNVLDNAIKFSTPGGIVSMQSVAKDRFIHLTIRDHGMGMDEATLRSVLSDDKSITQSDTSGHVSTGLGMPLVLSMIEKNHGKVDIVSAVGKGTTIELSLPRGN